MPFSDFKTLKRLLKSDLSALPVVKVSLLGDTATQFLATAIRGTGVERGYHIDLYEAEYDQVERQLLDPTSEFYEFNADFVVLFQSTHKLGECHAMLSSEQQTSLAEDRLNFVASVCANPALDGKKIICFNYPEIDDAVFGSYANRVPQSLTWQVRRLNCGLMDLSQQYPNLFICDIAALQNNVMPCLPPMFTPAQRWCWAWMYCPT